MNADLLQLVYDNDELADLDAAQRRLAIKELLATRIDQDEIPNAVQELASYIDGAGIVDRWLDDPGVTDILINGPGAIWIEKDGRLLSTGVELDAEDVRALAVRLMTIARIRADPSRPIADGRLPDGSRLHIVMLPVARAGPLISIRRFPRRCLQLDDLRTAGAIDEEQERVLLSAVRDRSSIVVSGATGAGKTTLVNALLSLVPPTERVVIVEETPELHPSCAHVVSLVTREANAEGEGRVELSDLVRAALRMRPDRLVVGEVRGPEAFHALGALASGHSGSLLTVHAERGGALRRLAYLASLARPSLSQNRLERDFRSCFDLVVHLEREEGRRRVVDLEHL